MTNLGNETYKRMDHIVETHRVRARIFRKLLVTSGVKRLWQVGEGEGKEVRGGLRLLQFQASKSDGGLMLVATKAVAAGQNVWWSDTRRSQ